MQTENADTRNVAELKDIHKDRLAFVIGNGWSVTYYDTSKMAKDGILIGCNRAHERHPLDYLVWQDSSQDGICGAFKGNKVTTRKKNRQMNDRGVYYIFGFGKGFQNNGNFRLMHSGGLALQLAVFIGCNPIILVGCDCRMFEGLKNVDKKYEGRRSNVFRDKQSLVKVQRGDMHRINGRRTTSHLQSFMKRFEQAYEAFKDQRDIYMLGDWSITTTIPWVEWEEYWSDEHPENNKRNR